MAKVLNLISSPRGAESTSIKLANVIIDKIKAADPDAVIIDRNLTQDPYPHLDSPEMNSFFTPAEYLTPEQKNLLISSDTATAELLDADIIIIGAPMYNFTVSSYLKTYMDRVARAGVTFRYTENGPEGLLKNKKAYIVAATGSLITLPEMQKYDFVVPFVKTFLEFIGITDISVFRVEGLAIPGIKETALEQAIEKVSL